MTLAVACGSSSPGDDSTAATVGPGSGTESPSPSASTVSPSTPSPTQDLSANSFAALSPEEILDGLFMFDPRANRISISPGAVDAALATGDERFLPPLVELTRWVRFSPAGGAVKTALTRMTGQGFAGDDFFGWYSWLGQNYSGVEFPNYPDWKARLYEHIDPRFSRWFFDGVKSEIPLWTAQWGGVTSDGIPPLDNPDMITAGEATFMEPDEQVFGVSINGDVRAYPFRFMNWHEMANDVVGGKPVTLAY